ncbi:prephenate dehydrogenase [Pseudalkalibacillus hwajinpoensis]|uniref:Prephenate dehydrogenase n=1 Tax=Guptibacillus hwajinpoensis TaxID=208199 RepID=A0A4V5PYE9_9BACL|nr:prephenate dehydrogenase [Pseudalkalibacillus hwajinpoensis]TKD69838.1 prephenate dehydrogenase [Pseudalkalibacillus hwajinpoensis]
MSKQVAVIGLGLIGGSIALAIKKNHKDAWITGFDVNENQLQLAKALRVVDETASSLEEAVQSADFIMIAAPVVQTEHILAQLSEVSLKSTVIISDVGSTKHSIVKHAKSILPPSITFIGGHPMAGSHKTGVSAAKSHLFENAFYILTPDQGVEEKDLSRLMDLLSGTNATFVELEAEEHDYLVGLISHFPHILAASLVNFVSESNNNQRFNVARFAAGGFRDITRIASASPVMWRDILLRNKKVLLQMTDDLKLELDRIRSYIEREDGDKIFDYFADAKDFRDGLPVRSRGAIPAFYDLFLDVQDQPGVIASVTQKLAGEEISITNIRIIETREDIMGVLRISFRSELDRDNAKVVLERDFDTYVDDK